MGGPPLIAGGPFSESQRSERLQRVKKGEIRQSDSQQLSSLINGVPLPAESVPIRRA